MAAAAAVSLCSFLTPKMSNAQTTASLSHSRTRICCLSNSFSSLTLLNSRKERTLSCITKATDEEAAEVSVVSSESENVDESAEVSVVSPESENVDEAAVEAEEKPKREEIFAVVMIGGRQYIVHPGRYIYTQRLKGANVNDKVTLNKVLLVGTKTSTWIGYPIVQNATVEAVVEEQRLDKKVIVFKYKKKKNYRRNIGHRQPITKIRVTSITGYQDSPAVTLPETSVA